MLEHKPIMFSGIGLLVLGIGLIGYSIFMSNPNNVVNFTTYGGNDTSEVDSAIKKTSVLGKDLPNAEDIIKNLSDNDVTELSDISEFISENYNEDINLLYVEGLIPSTSLTEAENIQIILAGNNLINDESNYYPTKMYKNTKDYIDSLGSKVPVLTNNENSVNLYTPKETNFNNIDDSFNLDDLLIKGVYLYTPVNEEDNVQTNIAINQINNYDVSGFQDFNEAYKTLNGSYILSVNFMITKNMKVSKIRDQISKLTLNDSNLDFLTLSDSMKDYADSLELGSYSLLDSLYYYYGDDYEIDAYSVLQVSFLVTSESKIYSGSNYLRNSDEGQIELSDKQPTNYFDNSVLYDNYEF